MSDEANDSEADDSKCTLSLNQQFTREKNIMHLTLYETSILLAKNRYGFVWGQTLIGLYGFYSASA